MRKKSKAARPIGPKGPNRWRMWRSLDTEVYGRRALVETVNSKVKRKMGDVVYGRTETSRRMEVLLRCVAHDIRRLMDGGHPI